MFWSALKAKVNTGLKYFQNIVKILRNYGEFLVLLYSTRKLSTATNQFSYLV